MGYHQNPDNNRKNSNILVVDYSTPASHDPIAGTLWHEVVLYTGAALYLQRHNSQTGCYGPMEIVQYGGNYLASAGLDPLMNGVVEVYAMDCVASVDFYNPAIIRRWDKQSGQAQWVPIPLGPNLLRVIDLFE